MPLRHHGAQGGRGVSRMPAPRPSHSPASAAAAAKALGSPTAFANPSMQAMGSPAPFSDSSRYNEQEQYRRKMLMSKHSEQHHTLIDLLRERGTLGREERVPEDDIFEDEEIAGTYGRGYGAGRNAREDEGTFATALAESSSDYHSGGLAPGHASPTGIEPAYGSGREMSERVPASSVPHMVSQLLIHACSWCSMFDLF
jgi:hypothetical protein